MWVILVYVVSCGIKATSSQLPLLSLAESWPAAVCFRKACGKGERPVSPQVLRHVLRLRGGLEMGSVDEDEEVNDGMNDSSNGDNSSDQDTASEQAGVYDAGSEPAIQDKQEPPADEQRSKRIRKKQRGPKNDPTGKRKHRGRRGGKHAKAARAKRAEVPLDESLQGEIQGVANTLAEISAAAPHAMEHAEPGTDGDPVMQYITPSQFDGLDDIKRRSIYDERYVV